MDNADDSFAKRMGLLGQAEKALKAKKFDAANEYIKEYVKLLPIDEDRKVTYELFQEAARTNGLLHQFMAILKNDREPLS